MYQGERLNAITHLIGTALAVAGSAVLIARAAADGDPWKVVSFSIFGAMMVVLYAMSTLYHSLRGSAKAVLRRLDHSAIYLLIAGTYTPFTLVSLRGAFGWTLFALIWTMALAGIRRAWQRNDGRDQSPWPYLVMGWLGLTAVVPLIDRIGAQGMLWLAAGALLYSGGIVFYANDRRWPHAHGIWHLFVLGGTASHFVTVLYFV